MPHTLTLSESDVETIAFVGFRYAWSDALGAYGPGEHTISEPDAWTLRDAFEADTEGGHSMFPMLDPRSELAEKLSRFLNEIV